MVHVAVLMAVGDQTRWIGRILSLRVSVRPTMENLNKRVQQDCNGLRATTKRRRDADFEIMNMGDEKNRLMTKNRWNSTFCKIRNVEDTVLDWIGLDWIYI